MLIRSANFEPRFAGECARPGRSNGEYRARWDSPRRHRISFMAAVAVFAWLRRAGGDDRTPLKEKFKRTKRVQACPRSGVQASQTRLPQKVTEVTKAGPSQLLNHSAEYSPVSIPRLAPSFLGCERPGQFWATPRPWHPLPDAGFAIGRVQAQNQGLFPCLLTRWDERGILPIRARWRGTPEIIARRRQLVKKIPEKPVHYRLGDGGSILGLAAKERL